MHARVWLEEREAGRVSIVSGGHCVAGCGEGAVGHHARYGCHVPALHDVCTLRIFCAIAVFPSWISFVPGADSAVCYPAFAFVFSIFLPFLFVSSETKQSDLYSIGKQVQGIVDAYQCDPYQI